MNSRERVEMALNHKEPDRIPADLGGTVLTTGNLTTDALKQYTQSIGHYLETAKKMKVEVELQNHPLMDAFEDRLALLTKGGKNPFVVGEKNYASFLEVITDCMNSWEAKRGK